MLESLSDLIGKENFWQQFDNRKSVRENNI